MQKRFISVLGLLFVGIVSQAQQNLTVAEAIKIAFKNSYDIQLVESNYAIAKNSNSYGYAGGLPTISATGNENKTNQTIQQNYADPSRNTTKSGVGGLTKSANLTASMILFNGYRIMTTKERLASIENQNQLLLQSQLQNTSSQVMQQYYNVVRQESYLKTIEKSIDASKERVNIVKTRQEVGVANQADVLQSNLDLNALVQAKENQLLVIAQAKADLANTIVLPEADVNKMNFTDTISLDVSLHLNGDSKSIESGINENPQLQALKEQIKINKKIEIETRALMYPTLRASTGYSFSSNQSDAGFSLLNENYGPFVGVNLSIPLYAGNASKKNLQNARTNTKIAQIQSDNSKQDVMTNAYKTFASYQNSIRQLPTEKENYAMSQALLELVMQKYKVGQATMVDVKQAQQSFENAGFRWVSLLYTAKIAEVELKRISNQLKF
jgi:outer membrane protein TolC